MAFEAKLMYKGKPLVRMNNEIYYGNMSDEYVVYMQVLTTKKENDEDMPDKVNVMLLDTDTSLAPKDRIVQKSMKSGMYNAVAYASIMLERALAGVGNT